MRRRIIASVTLALLLALAVPAAPATAVGTWTQETSGTIEDFYEVSFVDSNNGWAVDGSGGVHSTQDGGTTWTSGGPGSGLRLWSVDFVNVNTGWVVGVDGQIYRTDDGGGSWLPQTSNTLENLTDVEFVTVGTGWVVGYDGTILHTTDGGTTWTTQTSNTTQLFYGLDFVDASEGWAVGNGGTILHTTDGGTTWTAQTSGTTEGLKSVSFPAGASLGWAVGSNGTVLSTADSGATWASQTSTTLEHLYDVKFVDTALGWATGVAGTLLSTADGGATWAVQDLGTTEEFSGVDFVDASAGWIVGSAGTVFSYEDPDAVPDGEVRVTAQALAPEISLTFSITASSTPDAGSVTDSSIDFGVLLANTPKTGAHRLEVTTNALTGYHVTTEEDGPLTAGAFTIPDVTGDDGLVTESVEGAWDSATTYGFGYTLTDVVGASAAFTTGFRQFADVGSGESPQDVMSTPGPVSGDAVDVTYKANIDAAQEEGLYSNTLTYIATSNL